MSDFLDEGDKNLTVVMRLKLKGGGIKTIKAHLKQKDALSALTKKSQTIFRKK